MYYRADGEIDDLMPERDGPVTWRSSMYMPRWASRYLLEVTDVRVQRVQEISADDAHEEGIPYNSEVPIEQYEDLWDSINLKRGFGWDSNPWVWAITFRRIDAAAT
jgi:hypothetical protein